jgi:hypothetical protein
LLLSLYINGIKIITKAYAAISKAKTYPLGTPYDINGTINKDININRLNSILVFFETYWVESQDEHLNFF